MLKYLSLTVSCLLLVSLVSFGAEDDNSLSIQFPSKKEDQAKPSGGSSIIEGPELDSSEEPLKPPVLEPLEDKSKPGAQPTKTPTPVPKPTRASAIPTATPLPTLPAGEAIRSERLVPETSSPPVIESTPMKASDIITEIQPVGGQYQPVTMTDGAIQKNERLRFKYSKDPEWRVLEAYGATDFHFSTSHYEISGNFFHSFRDGTNRIQVPSIREARDRRDRPDLIGAERQNLRLFVEVESSAPKAPAPQGNCVVWQKGKLWLNDLVGGEVDAVVDGRMVDQLEVTSLIPGLIFILTPPSQLKLYAVKVDFEGEIFKLIGREKGKADRYTEEMIRLLQMADTPEKRNWCESRMTFEQEQSRFQSDRQSLYEMFLRNELDALGLIRSGHPLPYIQMAQTNYRHENLELAVAVCSDHLGKTLFLANATLWINESIPSSATPFTYEIVDQSDPSFVGYDTRFRTEGNKLLAEERFKGSTAWVPRNVVVDVYYYVTFRPPQLQGPPVYLADVTMDISGGLKRLNKEQVVNARLGTIQLSPDAFRIDVAPTLLVSSAPMERIIRDIILQPLDLRAWYAGRRHRIHEFFEKIPILPDELLDEIESAVDELGVKVYEVEKPKRLANPTYLFNPTTLSITLSRTTQPGELSLVIVAENENKESVQVTRSLFPKVDVLDLAARSVAKNRTLTRIEDIQPMTLAEWIALRQPRTLMSN